MKRYRTMLMIPLLLSTTLTYSVEPEAQGRAIFLDENASRCEIFRALSAELPAECQSQPKTIILPNTPAEVPPGSQSAPPHPASRSCRLARRIEFEFDTYRLTPGAKGLLDTVAEVLNDPIMAKKTVRIEGHTDASGSAQYNLILSRNRAQAVQRYLHQRFGIPIAQIPTTGKGEYQLYDPEHPAAAINRRVEFINVSDGEGCQ